MRNPRCALLCLLILTIVSNPGQNVDGQNVYGQNVDNFGKIGQNVDGQNVEGEKKTICYLIENIIVTRIS